MLLLAMLLGCGSPCVDANGEYFAKERPRPHCCPGSKPTSGAVAPDPDFEDRNGSFPEGCGPSGAPPDLFVCLPCGNGTCDGEEDFCNCPEDCDAPSG